MPAKVTVRLRSSAGFSESKYTNFYILNSHDETLFHKMAESLGCFRCSVCKKKLSESWEYGNTQTEKLLKFEIKLLSIVQ